MLKAAVNRFIYSYLGSVVILNVLLSLFSVVLL